MSIHICKILIQICFLLDNLSRDDIGMASAKVIVTSIKKIYWAMIEELLVIFSGSLKAVEFGSGNFIREN